MTCTTVVFSGCHSPVVGAQTEIEEVSGAFTTENLEAEAAVPKVDESLFADLERVSEEIVHPLLRSGMMSTYNWENPEQID